MHDNDLEVIGNLRESLASEDNARRDVEAKAFSLEAKLQEREEIHSKLETLLTYPGSKEFFLHIQLR